jgi:hypothetical protein
MNRLMEFLAMLMERRIGFKMDEVMEGTHHFVNEAGPPGEHPMSFRVTWGARNIQDFANPFDPGFMSSFLEGTVDVEGLARDAPCKGTLQLLYFTEGKIRYTFDFKDDRGRPCRYVGEKADIRPWNLYPTHTTCYGTITDADTGKEISRSIVYFRLSTTPAFLMSFRLA